MFRSLGRDRRSSVRSGLSRAALGSLRRPHTAVSRRPSGRDRRSSGGLVFLGRPSAAFVGRAPSLAPLRFYWPTAVGPFSRVGRSMAPINVTFARSRSRPSIVRSLGIFLEQLWAALVGRTPPYCAAAPVSTADCPVTWYFVSDLWPPSSVARRRSVLSRRSVDSSVVPFARSRPLIVARDFSGAA